MAMFGPLAALAPALPPDPVLIQDRRAIAANEEEGYPQSPGAPFQAMVSGPGDPPKHSYAEASQDSVFVDLATTDSGELSFSGAVASGATYVRMSAPSGATLASSTFTVRFGLPTGPRLLSLKGRITTAAQSPILNMTSLTLRNSGAIIYNVSAWGHSSAPIDFVGFVAGDLELVVVAITIETFETRGATAEFELIWNFPCNGDLDGDEDVDVDDYTLFQDCFTGTTGGPIGYECQCVDFDSDEDVDLIDFCRLQIAFTGPAS